MDGGGVASGGGGEQLITRGGSKADDGFTCWALGRMLQRHWLWCRRRPSTQDRPGPPLRNGLQVLQQANCRGYRGEQSTKPPLLSARGLQLGGTRMLPAGLPGSTAVQCSAVQCFGPAQGFYTSLGSSYQSRSENFVVGKIQWGDGMLAALTARPLSPC